jgi:hypothetical protein
MLFTAEAAEIAEERSAKFKDQRVFSAHSAFSAVK